MRRRLTVCLLLWLCATRVTAGIVSASGLVYADSNGNGVQDSGEAGLAGVGVSDGAQVVMTNQQGEYRIDIDDSDAMVFVLKPRNFQLPVDASNIPQFYYIHRPGGAPSRRFAGTEATGPLPDAINFGLLPRPEPDRFRVLVLSDTQTRDAREVDFYRRDVVAELEDVQDIAFGMTLGDVAFDDLNVYAGLTDATARIGVPWFYVLGNHDMNLDADDDRGSDDTYEAWFGPATYAFQYGPVHFIYFDDVIHWRDADGEPQYTGGLREDQFRFIASYLENVAASERVVLAMHIPFPARNDGQDDGSERFRASDRQRLMNLLARFPDTLSLSGHSHLQQHYFLGAEDGWRGESAHHHYIVGAASGSWWSGELDEQGIPHTTMRDGTPNGYAIIEFAPEGYLIDYKAARQPAGDVMRIVGPGTIVADSYPLGEVHANVFNGNQRSRVRYRIDNGPWQPMQAVQERDPALLRISLDDLARNTARSNTRVSPPIDSTHLWKARVPTDIVPGEHFVVVSVTDMFGREFRDSRPFLVQPGR